MSHPKTIMSGAEFSLWASRMVVCGIVSKETDLPGLLGITRQGFWLMKGRGCDRRTALACSAIASGLEPWTFGVKKAETKHSS